MIIRNKLYKLNDKLITYFFFLILGLIFRYFFLNENGTFDLDYFENFYNAIVDYNNLSYLYFPGFQNIENWKGYNLPVLYPPGFTYIFFFFSKFDYFFLNINTKIYIKIIFIVFEIILFTFLFFKSNKKYLVSIIFWINPLIILTGTCLGYSESISLCFLIISLFLLNEKKYFLGASLFILSCSIKQLALVLLPIYFFYFFKNIQIKKNLIYSFFIIIFIIIGCIPLIFSAENYSIYETLIGFFKNMYWAMFRDYITANGLNIWWVYSGVHDVINNLNSGETLINTINNLDLKFFVISQSNWGFENLLSKILIFTLTIINSYILFIRKNYHWFIRIVFFQYFGYVALATGTHENHSILLAYLSLLILLIDNNFWKISLIVNIYSFLNLWMFYGFNGDNILRQNLLWQVSSLLLSIFLILVFLFVYIKFLRKAFYSDKIK